MISSEPNPETDIRDWISDLPSYQRNLLLQLDSNCADDLEAFDVWIDSLSPANFAGYGSSGHQNLTSMKILLRNAVHDFLCSDKEDLVEQRNKYAQMSGLSSTAFVGFASAAVAPLVPLGLAFIVPGVAILLCFAAKIGTSAFCARMTELRSLDSSSSSPCGIDTAKEPEKDQQECHDESKRQTSEDD